MRTSALVSVAVVLNLALAGTAAVFLLTGDEGKPRDAADWLGDVAFVAVWALPAVVAVLGGRRFPFLLAAAILAFLAVPTTFSVSLLFVFPALLYVLAAAAADEPARLAGALAALAAVLLGAGAAASLFTLTEGRCWEYEVRSDGATVSRTVPTEGRWERRDGSVGGSGSSHAVGDGVVEAGGGCGDRATLAGGLLALGLAGACAGVGRLGRRLHSPA